MRLTIFGTILALANILYAEPPKTSKPNTYSVSPVKENGRTIGTITKSSNSVSSTRTYRPLNGKGGYSIKTPRTGTSRPASTPTKVYNGPRTSSRK